MVYNIFARYITSIPRHTVNISGIDTIENVYTKGTPKGTPKDTPKDTPKCTPKGTSIVLFNTLYNFYTQTHSKY